MSAAEVEALKALLLKARRSVATEANMPVGFWRRQECRALLEAIDEVLK